MHLSLKKHEFVRFISDLHLTKDPSRLNTFYHFIDTLPTHCKGLFILGDFFDHWLGADIHQKDFQILQTKLKKVTHCPIFFLAGNRDFLVEDSWLVQGNLKKINDPTVLHINNLKILLTHGDQLCTFDKAYQFFRTITRNKATQYIFKLLPKYLRQSIFVKIRNKKKTNGYMKKYAVNEAKVNYLCHKHHVNILIHGHIHQPGIHINNNRIVLDEWMADNHHKHDISYLDFDAGSGIILHQVQR